MLLLDKEGPLGAGKVNSWPENGLQSVCGGCVRFRGGRGMNQIYGNYRMLGCGNTRNKVRRSHCKGTWYGSGLEPLPPNQEVSGSNLRAF